MFKMIDIVMLVIMGLSILTGVCRGFVKESMALVVWALAVWLGIRYHHGVTPWFSSYVHDPMMQWLIGFLLIFLGVLMLGSIVNTILTMLLHRTGLTGTDRVLGMIFGFVRGVLMVTLMMVVFETMGFSKVYRQDSLLYPMFEPWVHWTTTMMPDWVKEASFWNVMVNQHK